MIKYILVICSTLLMTLESRAQGYSDSISVNFFLIDQCRICQNMTGEINKVVQDFSNDTFHFTAYFPNSSSSKKDMESFMIEFNLDIPFYEDYNKTKTKFYGASVAPQVVIYDELNEKLLYSGRIDNSYAQIGSRRRVVTSRDLKNTLLSIQNNKPITTNKTTPIGCYINK